MIVRESYKLNQAEPGFVEIRYDSDVQIDDRVHPSSAVLWLERANLGWITSSIEKLLKDENTLRQKLASGGDDLAVDESGPDYSPYINLTNRRPESAPHGGYYWVSMTRKLAASFVSDLKSIS